MADLPCRELLILPMLTTTMHFVCRNASELKPCVRNTAWLEVMHSLEIRHAAVKNQDLQKEGYYRTPLELAIMGNAQASSP